MDTKQTSFKHPDRYEFYKILSWHFHEGKCKGAFYKVQIPEKLEGNGRTSRNTLDASCDSFTRQREEFSMLKLPIVIPYS